jgi:hypothetical protein
MAAEQLCLVGTAAAAAAQAPLRELGHAHIASIPAAALIAGTL